MDDVTKALFSAETADEVRDLIARGADVNARNEEGQTALFLQSNRDVAVALIDAGCDVLATDEGGWTAVHALGSVEVCEVLISAGVNVNTQTEDGLTPLMAYLDRDHAAPLVAALLAAGADLSLTFKNHEGKQVTALDIAEYKSAEYGREDREVRDLIKAHVEKAALNSDDTLTRLKDSKPATPKKRGPL